MNMNIKFNMSYDLLSYALEVEADAHIDINIKF